MTDEEFTRHEQSIVDAIRPILAGHDPRVQGAAIAELFAQWLYGHHALDGTPASKVRAELKAHTLELVDAILESYDRGSEQHRAHHAH